MIRAGYNDKTQIVAILSASFDDNKSVNYITKQDKKRKQRIRALMNYSFEICYRAGKVFISEDKKACALVIFPDKKRTTLYTVFNDFKLFFLCLGFTNLIRVLRREKEIKSVHPKDLIYYLWFIGVAPAAQGKGAGSKLIKEVIADAKAMNRLVCLETSTLRNIPWYGKFGFKIYKELDFGYKLYCMKRE